MLEYFLTAYCPNDKIDAARAALQGVCGMYGRHEFKRVLFYPGPDKPDGFKKLAAVEKSKKKASFVELQRYLARQSFILRLEYLVTKQELGSAAQPQSLDQRNGTLRWTDLPEPQRDDDQLHIHRKMLVIEDQENLVSLVQQNAHTFKAECIEESYTYCLDDVEYCLRRNLHIPQGFTSASGGPNGGGLPALADLRPDPFWFLHLRDFIGEATPELSNLAVELLLEAKEKLGTCFDFKRVDRRLFDTRVQVTPTRNAMPQPLGSVVPVAK